MLCFIRYEMVRCDKSIERRRGGGERVMLGEKEKRLRMLVEVLEFIKCIELLNY